MERFANINGEKSKKYHIKVWWDNFKNEALAEGFEKVKGGVRYYTHRYKAYDMEKFKRLKKKDRFPKGLTSLASPATAA